MYFRVIPFLLVVASWAIGCTDRDGKSLLSIRRTGTDSSSVASSVAPATPEPAAAYGPDVRFTREELERGRMDEGWKRYVAIDTSDTAPAPLIGEALEDVTPERVNTGEMALPLYGDVAGPSVLRAQILLDRVRFSPGVVDGHWGKNVEKAVYWFQRREGLKATGRLDSTTYRRLLQLAGEPDSFVVRHRLTAGDVEGPFLEVPEDVYAQARLDRLGYASLAEKLAERFHTTQEVLAHLNPGVALEGLTAGDTIAVPNLQATVDTASGAVARIVVSEGAHYLHALDASGRIRYHFPASLGSRYDPSPTGTFEVVDVTRDPSWYYQPELLAHVPDTNDAAMIPPGPNNAVGSVWIKLSEPHFGIHGTSAPEAVGYASSAGCVRLTNWDALFLADHVEPGTPVQFRDVVQNGSHFAPSGSAGINTPHPSPATLPSSQ